MPPTGGLRLGSPLSFIHGPPQGVLLPHDTEHTRDVEHPLHTRMPGPIPTHLIQVGRPLHTLFPTFNGGPAREVAQGNHAPLSASCACAGCVATMDHSLQPAISLPGHSVLPDIHAPLRGVVRPHRRELMPGTRPVTVRPMRPVPPEQHRIPRSQKNGVRKARSKSRAAADSNCSQEEESEH